MGKRIATVGVLVVAVLAAPMAGGTAGAAKTADACSLITEKTLAALPDTYTIDKTDALSKTNCLYSLQGTGASEGSSDTVNLFVDPLSDSSMDKAQVKKAKAIKGLNGGYSGVVGYDPEVGFKTKSAVIRLGGTLDAAGLVAVAKALNTQPK